MTFVKKFWLCHRTVFAPATNHHSQSLNSQFCAFYLPKSPQGCKNSGNLCLILLFRKNEFDLQWTPSNPATLGNCQSVLIRGEFALGSIIWDNFKWPQYRGGLISGVQIRGSSLCGSWICVLIELMHIIFCKKFETLTSKNANLRLY